MLGEQTATEERRIIMVVEDDPDLRAILRELLESVGYEVITAEDGRAALRQLKQRARKPHLILADLRMPGMDGWQLISAAKSCAALATIPIGVQSSEAEHPEGAAFYIKKPVDVEALFRLVRRHLRQ